ncbi:MAG: M48 family metalloprotease [Proteobacteria bacterium]|nr:M48 family metalloprotease [Pseudomonadota bacterium]
MFNIKISPTAETNIKSALTLAALMTMIGTIGSFVAGTSGILISTGITFGIAALSMWYARELSLWLMSAKEIAPDAKPEGFDLHNMVDKLRKLEHVNLPVMPKVCIIESKTKNAFATGRHQGHTAIAITTGLLQEAKNHAKGNMADANRWIEAILLHELGHIVNRDIATKTAASIMVSSVRLLSESLYEQRLKQRQEQANQKSKENAKAKKEGKEVKESNESPSVLRNIAEYLLFNWVIPYTGTLVSLCLSRTREFAADDMAAKCGRAKDMAQAFELLRKPCEKDHDHATKRMETLSAMMCASLNPEADQQIANQLKDPQVGTFKSMYLSVQKAFSTHPALDDRIERMLQQAKESAPAKKARASARA